MGGRERVERFFRRKIWRNTAHRCAAAAREDCRKTPAPLRGKHKIALFVQAGWTKYTLRYLPPRLEFAPAARRLTFAPSGHAPGVSSRALRAISVDSRATISAVERAGNATSILAIWILSALPRRCAAHGGQAGLGRRFGDAATGFGLGTDERAPRKYPGISNRRIGGQEVFRAGPSARKKIKSAARFNEQSVCCNRFCWTVAN